MKFATTVKPKDFESREQGITLKIKPIGGSVSAVMLTDKYGYVIFYIVKERPNGTDRSNNMRAQEVAASVIALEPQQQQGEHNEPIDDHMERTTEQPNGALSSLPLARCR